MDKKENFEDERIKVRKEKYQAGKKNLGGTAYNIVNLGYEASTQGKKLE